MPRWRHLLVTLLLIPALIVYLAIVMAIADHVAGYHVLIDILFYAIAGLAWIPGAARVIGWLAKHEAS